MDQAVLSAGGATPARTNAYGLEGVLVAETRLSHVDGERGELVIAGERVERLAAEPSFEDTAARLLALGDGTPVRELRAALGRARVSAQRSLSALALAQPEAMDSLLAAVAQMSGDRSALGVLGALPVFVAAFARTRAKLPFVSAEAERGLVADFLVSLGLPADAPRVRLLETYLVTVSDHGLNASTFAARVVASTGSDTVPCVLAALAALKGPLHGGAPGPVLDMLDATQALPDPRSWLEAELGAGRRLMGMGHRIYRVRDPRAFVFERAVARYEAELAASALPGAAAIASRLAHARRLEAAAETLLRERHPDRPLCANAEFYTAILLEAVGIPRELFTAVFAIGRCAGWLAHIEEQRRTGRLIRPAARYIGAQPADS